MDKIKLFFFAALVVVVSCAKEAGSQEESEIVSSVEMVFTASRDAEVQTRTSRLENGDLWWSPADEIKIFNGTFASGKFISQNSEMAATATFRGSLDAATGTIESGSGSVGFMALYPYDENATCDGSSITFTLPSVQTGADDPFGNGTFPAVAQSNDLNLAFYNVCGGVKFSVAKSGILSVTFKSNGDEPIAGKIRVYFNEEGVPAFDVVDGVTEVVVNAPGAEGFEVGKDYYAILLPSSLSTGFSMVFNRDFQEAKFVTNNQIQVSRSRFGILNQLDNNLEYKPVEGNIVFADPKLKTILVVNYDTNGDGELSYAEAAAVTSLENAFEIKSFSSFDEFRFFINVERIQPSMFEKWTKMTSISLPESIISIGKAAFSGCSSLTSITIPERILYLNEDTFKNCSGLESITLPEKMDRIYANAFAGCSSLKSITFPEGLKSIYQGAFSGCTSLSSIELPEKMIKINDYTFSGCSNLKTVHLPTTVTSIGIYAFYGCSSLVDFTIPESVTSIGENAFRGCTGLMSIVIPKGVSTIESRCFADCSSLSSVSFSGSPRYIKDWAFNNCSSLLSISIPEGVLSIGQGAFFDCSKLASIVLPESVIEMISNAFHGCISLQSIEVNSNNPVFDSRNNCNAIIKTDNNMLIQGCERTIIPDSITSIGWNAFSGCVGLMSIALPMSLTSIGQDAFHGCTGLTSLVIPERVITIESLAFASCYGLTTIVLPKYLTSIGSQAFASCTSLISIVIPESVTKVGPWSFKRCNKLESITLLSNTPPQGGTEMFDETNSCPIYVPAESLNAYKSAQYWCDYASRIEAIPTSSTIPEAIDLGLSVKWASFNLGANNPEDYGDFYSWGEVESKDKYYWDTYKWCMGNGISLNKYCNQSSFGIFGFTDVKYVLDSEDDAARSILGDGWRIPIDAEIDELLERCSWEEKIVNGRFGQKITGPNGNSIFLPYSGYMSDKSRISQDNMGYYWSSCIRLDYCVSAYVLRIKTGDNQRSYLTRPQGCSIRPVYDDGKIKDVDLGLSVKWASANLGTRQPTGYGDYYSWGEIETKTDYLWMNYKWCNGDNQSLLKYNTDNSLGENGFTDGKTTLERDDDVAHYILGENWRIPTKEEWEELHANCSFEETTYAGVKGYKVKSLNGNSIFLPCAGQIMGYGGQHSDDGVSARYWSSSLNVEVNSSAITSEGSRFFYRPRFGGLPIRPVTK